MFKCFYKILNKRNQTRQDIYCGTQCRLYKCPTICSTDDLTTTCTSVCIRFNGRECLKCPVRTGCMRHFVSEYITITSFPVRG